MRRRLRGIWWVCSLPLLDEVFGLLLSYFGEDADQSQMERKAKGSMVFIGSMSGSIVNVPRKCFVFADLLPLEVFLPLTICQNPKRKASLYKFGR